MTHSLAESLQNGSPAVWAHDWLTLAGFPTTAENVRAVVSWELAESGGGGGMWNPLNTTQGGYAGESNANSVGVKNYTSRGDGLAANAKVIHNGDYGGVVAAFMAGDNAQRVVDAIVVSPWGTRRINLVGPEVVPVPPKPIMEVDMLSYPYPHPNDVNRQSGVDVDVANNRVQVIGNAKIDQATVNGFWGPPNVTKIKSSYAEAGGVVVITHDGDLYHLRWV